MAERRFTDDEVALVLKRAAELERRSPSPTGARARGLTLRDLEEIAEEAGIEPTLIAQAVREMAGVRRFAKSNSLTGPPTTHREVRAVPRELTREELAELIRLVDDEVADQGVVQEALGSVRWTGKGRFLSTQVAVEPGEGETLVRVEERFTPQFKGALQGVPAGYGLMFGYVAALEWLAAGVVPGTLLALGATLVGWGVGGALWRFFSSRSRGRVRRLAEALGLRAEEMVQDSDWQDPALPWPEGEAPEPAAPLSHPDPER